MKKILIIALFVGLGINASSCTKEPTTSAQTIIEEFVNTYFPNETVLAIIRDGYDYDVTLSDYTQIDFDGSMFSKPTWDEVDCSRSTVHTAVPATLVPTEIADYVNRVYPGQPIVKISKDRREWDVKLGNGIEVEFNSKFVVIEMD